MEKRARWLTDKYICLMLLVFPLWTGFDGYADITRPKFLFFAALTGLWLASLLACALIYRCRPGKPTAFQTCALCFAAAACVSTAFSEYFPDTLIGASRCDGLLTLTLYGSIAVFVSRWGEFKQSYVNLTALASGLCALVCVLQLCRVNVLGLFPAGLDFYDAGVKYTGEFLSTMGNTNVLAAYFCLTIPLLVCSAPGSKPLRRALLLLAAAAELGVLVFVRAESGLVACLAALPLAVLYYVNRSGRRRAALGLLGGFAALGFGALAVVYFAPPADGTLWELSELLHGRVQDSFGSSRVAIWREAARLAAERPLTGGGPDTFGLRSALDFSRYVPETGATLSTHADNAHCEPLGYLVNLGVPGLAAYVSVVISALRRWLGGAAPALGAALICYLVQSLFGLGLCLVVPIAWIYMGLICAPSEVMARAG